MDDVSDPKRLDKPPDAKAVDIAFFIRALEGGGAQRDAILLANAIARQGRRVAIATLQPHGHLRAAIDAGVPVIVASGGQLRSAVPGLRRTLRTLAPRVLVSAEAAPNALAVVATRLLPRARRPRLILREVATPSVARRLDPYRQNRLAYKVVRLVYPLADRVVTLTEGARDDLVGLFGIPAGKIAVLASNAVIDEAAAIAIADAPDARTPGLVVSLGRLSPEKDHATLIRAVALLRPRPGLRIEIAGEGPLHGRVEALIQELGVADRVDLIGRIADPFGLLNRASLAVCSSLYEGFGNAIVEALACGTPVVSTDCPYGPGEILDHGRFGTLVPVGDPASLAAAIDAALDAPVDRAALRARAAQHTVERAAEAFLAVVDGL
jgi:glycosyltransferase involved in cell wall biosynthesis